MLAGAATEILAIVLSFSERTDLSTWSARHHPELAQGQINALVRSGLIWATVNLSIFAVLWIGMAFVIRAGHHWGRITGTILFGIYTVVVGADLSVWSSNFTQGPHPALTIAAIIAPWWFGLATLIPLWMERSSAYFQPRWNMPPSGHGHQHA